MGPISKWLALKGIVKPSPRWSERDRFVVWDSLRKWDEGNELMTNDFRKRRTTSTFPVIPGTAYADFSNRYSGY